MGKDPEERTTKTGIKVIEFSFAANINKEKTIWYSVTMWPQTAERFKNIMPHLKKGKGLVINAEILSADAYIGRDGDPRSQIRISPVGIHFIGGEKKEEDRILHQDSLQPTHPPVHGQASAPVEQEEDLPF
jgi:single-strand DNA-binding protein